MRVPAPELRIPCPVPGGKQGASKGQARGQAQDKQGGSKRGHSRAGADLQVQFTTWSCLSLHINYFKYFGILVHVPYYPSLQGGAPDNTVGG